MTAIRVYIPCDTTAVACGAEKVARAIQRLARERSHEIEIVRNGSRGMLWLEPLVEVETPAGRVGYGPVRAEDVDGVPVALVRDRADRVHAIHDMCSHANVPLSDGEVLDGEIECWLHGSTFALDTGKPSCLPAVEPVPVYPVKIEDGAVYVAVNQEN